MKNVQFILLVTISWSLTLLASCRGNANKVNFQNESPPTNIAKSNTACKWENGTHSASVDYTNPSTDYSTTYTLDIVVSDCEVIRINFPNGGWLDSDHITPATLDENGYCVIEGEDGKTYEIQIEE